MVTKLRNLIAEDKQPVRNWNDFILRMTEFTGRWHFRGTLYSWDLQTSLERVMEDWSRPNKVDFTKLPALESRLLREFKRGYPSTSKLHPPPDEDDLAWLALMQHHGAPTRLLDWTYSPFVAAFFALDALLGSTEEKATIWAVSHDALESAKDLVPTTLKGALEKFAIDRDGPSFRLVFREAAVTFVALVNPYRLNERLLIQQGVFLCPGNIEKSFEENLLAIRGSAGNLRRITLTRDLIRPAFAGLHRMNVNYATLFPGLDGYARKLRHRVCFLQTDEFFDATRE